MSTTQTSIIAAIVAFAKGGTIWERVWGIVITTLVSLLFFLPYFHLSLNDFVKITIVILIGILSIIIPIFSRILISIVISIVYAIKFFLLDLRTGGKATRIVFKYTPTPTIIMIVAIGIYQQIQYGSLIDFNLLLDEYSINKIRNLLQGVIDQDANHIILVSLGMDLLLILVYVIYFWNINKLIDDELKISLKHNLKFNIPKVSKIRGTKIVDKSSDSEIKEIRDAKIIYVMIIVLAFADLSEDTVLLMIARGQGDFDLLTQVLQALTILKAILFAVIFLIILLSMLSDYFFRFRILEPNDEQPYPFDSDQVLLMAQLSALAYETPADIKKSIDMAPVLNRGKLTYHEFIGSGEIEANISNSPTHEDKIDYFKNSTQGMIVSQTEKGRLSIYTVFRGTELNKDDILLNLETGFEYFDKQIEPDQQNNPVKIRKSLQVHKGFLMGYLTYERTIQHALVKILSEVDIDKNEITKIDFIFSGHSLGGAIATIAAARLCEWFETEIAENNISLLQSLENYDISFNLFNVGSPKVGNRNFKNYYSRIDQQSKFSFNYLRSRNDKEWAAFLPPFGFSHILPSIYWSKNEKPKYRTEKNRFIVVNMLVASFSLGFFVKYLVPQLLSFVGYEMTGEQLFHGKKGNEFVDDHNSCYHIFLFVKELGLKDKPTSETIYFKAIRGKYDSFLQTR